MLYPDAEDADLGQSLTTAQVRWLTGEVSDRLAKAAMQALRSPTEKPPTT